MRLSIDAFERNRYSIFLVGKHLRDKHNLVGGNERRDVNDKSLNFVIFSSDEPRILQYIVDFTKDPVKSVKFICTEEFQRK
jgi:hypothetical protein